MSESLSTAIPSWGSPTLEGFDDSSAAGGQRIRGTNRQYVRFYKKKFMEVYTIEAKINDKTGTSTPVKVGTREVEKEMVHIVTPGDKNEVDDVACDYHKREHWAQYKAFREGRTAPLGTALEECSFISPSVALELKYHSCHTLEQLSDASDLLCNQIPDGFALREFARAHVKASTDNKSLAQVNALKSELADAKKIAETQAETLLSMQKQIEEMKSLLLDSKGKPVSTKKTAQLSEE